MRYCRNCGAQIDDLSKFCKSCGSRTEIENSDTGTSQASYVQEKPIYKKRWNEMNHDEKKKTAIIFTIIFVVIAIVALVIIVPSSDEASKTKRIEMIGQPSMTVEYIEYLGYSVNVRGKLINNGKTTTYISVTFNLYNASGAIIGSVIDNHNTLEKGAVWQFEACVGYYGDEKPVRAELADITVY